MQYDYTQIYNFFFYNSIVQIPDMYKYMRLHGDSIFKGKFSKKHHCAWSTLGPLGLRAELQSTLGTVEVVLLLLLAAACAPGRVAQVPLALGNEVQHGLVISIHDQALLGRRVSALSSGVARSAEKSQLSAVAPTGAAPARTAPVRETIALPAQPRGSWEEQSVQVRKTTLVPLLSEAEEGLSGTTGGGRQGPTMVAHYLARTEPLEGRGFVQERKFRKLLIFQRVSAIQSRHLKDMVVQISIFT